MPADWIERQNDPYDNGYWRRYDGKRRPSDAEGVRGWNDCDAELRFEALED